MKASAIAIMAMLAFASGANASLYHVNLWSIASVAKAVMYHMNLWSIASGGKSPDEILRYHGEVTCYTYAVERVSSYTPIREVVNNFIAYEYVRRRKAYAANREGLPDTPFYEGQAACAFRVLQDVQSAPDTRAVRIGLAARYVRAAREWPANLASTRWGSAYGGLNMRQRREADERMEDAERAVSEAQDKLSEHSRYGSR